MKLHNALLYPRETILLPRLVLLAVLVLLFGVWTGKLAIPHALLLPGEIHEPH